jgi:hypothetical protein
MRAGPSLRRPLPRPVSCLTAIFTGVLSKGLEGGTMGGWGQYFDVCMRPLVHVSHRVAWCCMVLHVSRAVGEHVDADARRCGATKFLTSDAHPKWHAVCYTSQYRQ